MTKTVRSRYTLEFKQEAVRLMQSEQSIAEVSRVLGIVEQTLFNWVKMEHDILKMATAYFAKESL